MQLFKVIDTRTNTDVTDDENIEWAITLSGCLVLCDEFDMFIYAPTYYKVEFIGDKHGS